MIPSEIRREVWQAYEEMRLKIRKPMTDRARALVVAKLAKIGDDPNEILDQSIQNSWQGVFPLRRDGARPGPQSEPRGFGAIRELRIAEGRDPETGEPLEKEVRRT